MGHIYRLSPCGSLDMSYTQTNMENPAAIK